MIRHDLPTLYACLHSLSRKLRLAQTEYFAGALKGYKEPHKLEACKERERQLKEWINEHWKGRKEPATYNMPEPEQLKEYLHLMNRVVYLLKEQAVFYDTRKKSQLQKCKCLEAEVDKLIKNKTMAAAQPTLL